MNTKKLLPLALNFMFLSYDLNILLIYIPNY